jgi:ribose/xylose/arabinose/galactoside ABC-type transport system permease subunit
MLLESVGGNAEASRLSGVSSRNLILLAYVFSGLCAGIAGLMISSNVSSADGNNAGLWIELDAILAVVIGGTALTGGRYFLGGTVVGALVIQTLTTTIYSIGIPPETTLLFKALIVTVVCLLQSSAFRAKVFGRPSPQPQPAVPEPHLRLPQKYVPAVASLALFAVMFTAGAFRYEAFGSGQVILNILVDNSFLLVVAVGMTFVILAGGIDLSVGAVVALGTVLCGVLIQKQGWSPYLVVPIVVLVGSTLGFAMGCMIHYFELQPFIVTLAGLSSRAGRATRSRPIRSRSTSRRS